MNRGAEPSSSKTSDHQKGVRVYFAAAMRGGRDNLKTNQQIVAYLSQLGHEVLTLHVTDNGYEQREAELSDRRIYERDMALLGRAEVVVAEATTPSLGTGYEIAEALRQNIPVLCLHRTDTALPFSALIAGISHPRYYCVSYTGDTWQQALKNFLSHNHGEAGSRKYGNRI